MAKNSIFINTKWWFDSTGGQPYFSSRVFVDGECVATLPFQNGSVLEMPQYEALKALQGLGIIAPSFRVLWHINRDLPAEQKIAIYTATERVTKRECKRWAEVTL